MLSTTTNESALEGKTYRYSFTYDENYRIRGSGGNFWIADHILVDRYDDVNVALAQIEDCFRDRGGTFVIIEGSP